MDESKKSLLINNLEQFSCFHNFRFEDSGICLWKAIVMARESFSHTTQCMFNIKDQLCFKRKIAFPIQSEKER